MVFDVWKALKKGMSAPFIAYTEKKRICSKKLSAGSDKLSLMRRQRILTCLFLILKKIRLTRP